MADADAAAPNKHLNFPRGDPTTLVISAASIPTGLTCWVQPWGTAPSDIADATIEPTRAVVGDTVTFSFTGEETATLTRKHRLVLRDTDTDTTWASCTLTSSIDGDADSPTALSFVDATLELAFTISTFVGSGGGGGGSVDSVNGQTGVVELDAGDVGAATAAQGATADTALQPGANADQIGYVDPDLSVTTQAGYNVALVAALVDAYSAVASKMDGANSLSEIPAQGTPAIARTNLGLGTAAVADTTDFDAAGSAASAQAAAIAASQPLDSDLTAIAALTTTSYGRAFLALADAAAGRTALGLGTAATTASTAYQPVDSDLTAIAALTTTSYGRALLALADGASLAGLLPRDIVIVALDSATSLTTGDGKGNLLYPVPKSMNGKNIIGVKTDLATAAPSGTPTFQLARIRAGTPVDVLTVKSTIDATELSSNTAATAATINTSNDDLVSDATGCDYLRIDCDDAGGAGAKGLTMTITVGP